MKRKNRILVWMLWIALGVPLVIGQKSNPGSLWDIWSRYARGNLGSQICDIFLPAFFMKDPQGNRAYWLLGESIDQLLPLYGYVAKTEQAGLRETGWDKTEQRQDAEIQVLAMPDGISLYEKLRQGNQEEVIGALQQGGYENGLVPPQQRGYENGLVSPQQGGYANAFVPHQQRVWLDLDKLANLDTLLETFYTVDPSTTVSGIGINAKQFLSHSFSVSKEGEEPRILIFHTHSAEGFVDSAPGDAATSIVAVGEHLADILRNKYGYSVLHHTESYDLESRDGAYSKALQGVEKILQENPRIEVVIDLHRDEVKEGTKLVMDLDGRPTARFMFFNGLSKTKKTGDISYLYNENREANLAFSFQMQLMAAQYYPGLTRKIYLKGYRYNMHLKEKYLLVELGAQNNTLEEALNACDPLAHILDLVLDN